MACLLMWVAPTLPTIFSLCCFQTTWFKIRASVVGFVFGASSLVAIPAFDCRIFIILRRHQRRIQEQSAIASRFNNQPRINIVKYRKSVYAMPYVVVDTFVNYVLFGVCLAVMFYSDETPQLRGALEATLTVVFLNFSINPFIYCWRLREIRCFVMSTFRHLCGLYFIPSSLTGTLKYSS